MRTKAKTSVFDVINYIILALFALITLYPFWYTLVGSFSHGTDYMAGGVWLFPRKFALDNYLVVLTDMRLYRSLLITVSRLVLVTFLQLLFLSMVAYAFSHPALKGKKRFMWLNLVTRFFSGGIIPYFYIINLLGLYDTYWVYILPSVYSVYNMIIVLNFFKSIPEEFRDVASLDGASEFRICFTIFVPLSKAVLATVALWVSTGVWNNFMTTAIYTQNSDLMTLQYYLKILIQSSSGSDSPYASEAVSAKTISYAAMVVVTIPVICLYPFLQKYFGKGVMVGGVKE